MTHQTIIEHTMEIIRQLPVDKAMEVSDFADFINRRCEEEKLTKEITQMVANSKCFDFLNEEEDLYSENDLQEIYNV